jgi:DNA-binding PadR family transcriptional regulator
MAVSRVEAVVLGLLGEEQLYGYQILERFRERGMEHWARVGRASVYQALHRLEREGFITGRTQGRGEGPDRRVYRISRSGRDRLREALRERLAGGHTAQSEAGVALGLAHSLGPSGVRGAIGSRQAEVSELIRSVDADRAGLRAARAPGAQVARRMLDLQAAYLRAERTWLAVLRRDAGRLRR